jgi:hypothetical protein
MSMFKIGRPVLLGTWRTSNGMIFCGTLRIAAADFDTNPTDAHRDAVLQDICDTMNEWRESRSAAGRGLSAEQSQLIAKVEKHFDSHAYPDCNCLGCEIVAAIR